MNQNQIQQLTTHLSQALDQNYDVVNMEAVLSVICALEGTTITKEQLEATRLAKYINQLRRRTKNETLARRAKSLLKKWREMVGIQQTATEVVPTLPPKPLADLSKSTMIAPPEHLGESVNHLSFSQSLADQQIISNVQSNIEASELAPLGLNTQLNTNFSNHVYNMPDESNSITTAVLNCRDQCLPTGSPQPGVIIEQPLNSVLNLTGNSTAEKLTDVASVVIDIVSDSDENDNNCGSKPEIYNSIVSDPIAIPSTPSSRQKKQKKEKRIKQKEGQAAQNIKLLQSALATDSEIFSLSNSSMSSILSGEAATLGNSKKTRLSSSELTFTGRFKSLNQNDLTTQSNSSFLAEQNGVLARSNLLESGKPKLDEYNAYDSSASCSRLSPSTVEDIKKMDNVIDLKLHSASMPDPGTGCDPNSRHRYLENASQSQIPKRRGRKKGSKGVDAVIAKESSSLSQQIFFGGSTVKKVKTTKELFNEIQSRKFSVSMQSSASNCSNSSIKREQAGRAIFPRPTSSCSDTSMHSPQILETFTNQTQDPTNTDSDTVTSEPSRDSNKSEEIKECSSLDSNSNSNNNLHLANNLDNLMPTNFHDITTQLVHLIHSLNSPLTAVEIEKIYQTQLVPCTCVVIEEVPRTLGASNPLNSDAETNNQNVNLSYQENLFSHNTEENLTALERNGVDEEGESQAKPVKSIFDLDFDDNDDPLHSILDDTRKTMDKVDHLKSFQATKNEVVNVALHLVNSSAETKLNNQQQSQERDNNETNSAVLPVFNVLEDPNCVAKQQFYVQTNQITNFHINALHNFYIPNINGNWDIADSNPNFQSQSHFLHTLDSYSVTDGADVVPKYGHHTIDRIRKDLTSLKFIKPFKAKPFKFIMSPFLGVAKCLPTCRRAKRMYRQCFGSKMISDKFPKKRKPKVNIPSPLNVNIDVPISGINSHHHVPTTQVNSVLKKTTLSTPVLDSCSSVNGFSNNLLKLADNEIQFGEAEINDKSSGHEYQDTSSSSCSYASLNETQDSNNKKNVRNRSISRKSEASKRNKGIHGGDVTKKKKYENYELDAPLKRIKKAFNSTSNSDNDSDNGAENDNNKEEYAIVQRPIVDGVAFNNHIVLTIKKTPSKINSPANSMPMAVSPNNTLAAEKVNKIISISHLQDSPTSQNKSNVALKNNLITKKIRITPRPLQNCYRRTSRKPVKGQRKTIDLELKHLFRLSPEAAPASSSKVKIHNKLFFHHELCRENPEGMEERIINYSSSSSSSSYDDDSEADNSPSEEEMKPTKLSAFDVYQMDIETESSDSTEISEVQVESEEDSFLNSLYDKEARPEKYESVDDDELNDFQNNRMLQSFNSIFATNQESSPPRASLTERENENSDANNIYFNNNNINVSNIHRKSMEPSQEEYRTGVRSVLDSPPPTSVADMDLTRIQQFKEWHQVLQLKSYNNEPLIVLPYVLLE
ncbi:mediator of RNA polymerase II transcription subunit 26 [Drosophila ficusphila]|uniref:mediator of RNA polymerase II transcription subunit 26 n=1 Tax=Drosophila ficusphila TaxID=30025 RepID=UPI001C88FF7A|nr:mediator of RNA polymerase II transcription subunit 26 [Drosophila ficusphila]